MLCIIEQVMVKGDLSTLKNQSQVIYFSSKRGLGLDKKSVHYRFLVKGLNFSYMSECCKHGKNGILLVTARDSFPKNAC